MAEWMDTRETVKTNRAPAVLKKITFMKDSHSSKHMFQDYILDLFLCVMLSLRPVAFFLSSSARVCHLMSPVVTCMISVA